MSDRSWSNSLNTALAEIDKLDLSSIRWKLTDKRQGLGWSQKKANEAEAGYKK